jgi:hypothetical protein
MKPIIVAINKYNTRYDLSMYDVDNVFLSYISPRKFRWYLQKNVATRIDETSIRLNKELPIKRFSHHNQQRSNICHICGANLHGIAKCRYRIIPKMLKRCFPRQNKCSVNGDIIIMCDEHHPIFEKYTSELFEKLCERYECDKDGLADKIKEADDFDNFVKFCKDSYVQKFSPIYIPNNFYEIAIEENLS